MTRASFDFLVLGGGLVGLATARELQRRHLGRRVGILEKEASLAAHQSSHNSGVLHSGVYYRPGSLKARLCQEGRARLLDFCLERRIAHRLDGKVIVATEESELPALEEIARRGHESGVPGVERISAEEICRHEPHVRGIAGVWVPSAGVVDFPAVAQALGEEIRREGGEVLLGAHAQSVDASGSSVRVRTTVGELPASRVIACAGLQSDRLAGELAEVHGVRIVPFRGDYYGLQGSSADRIRALVYPVPDPRFPFLGVHFARHIHGDVTAGPNAVLALAREQYRRMAFDARDCGATLRFPGFWRLARRHWRKGWVELWRSASKRAYWKQLRRLVPDLRLEDVSRGPCGIRAQAVRRDGTLVEDFLFLESGPVIHVLNAPSPAATSSLAIAREIVDRIDGNGVREGSSSAI